MPGRKLNATLALTLLAPATIGAAAAGVLSTPVTDLAAMESVAVECVFTYGSGGTSVTAYVQTSLTGGLTWFDIMAFQFTTATARRLSSVRSGIALAANVTPGDAALTVNTILDGVLGDRLRIKYTSVGTYGGATSLAIYAVTKG